MICRVSLRDVHCVSLALSAKRATENPIDQEWGVITPDWMNLSISRIVGGPGMWLFLSLPHLVVSILSRTD